VDGELEVGVVHHVPDGDIYSAVRDEGAYLNDERITVSEVDDLSDALLSTGFTADSPDEEDTFALLRHLLERTHGIRRFGSAAYDLATVAYGVVDCFYERHIRPWDVAAGILIVEEAGGRVTDYEGEDGWKSVREGGNEIVATNGDADVHDEVLRLHDEVVERVGVADEGLRTWK
ncbi:MAG: inositol monophosphatase family protein, partial [Halobacteria archaeon]|nr:inositol monophosphatase family protein [Halobacteria archaeon]